MEPVEGPTLKVKLADLVAGISKQDLLTDAEFLVTVKEISASAQIEDPNHWEILQGSTPLQ